MGHVPLSYTYGKQTREVLRSIYFLFCFSFLQFLEAFFLQNNSFASLAGCLLGESHIQRALLEEINDSDGFLVLRHSTQWAYFTKTKHNSKQNN